MSLITDFFVATPEDLAKISPDKLSGIYDEFRVIQANQVDPVKLASLQAIIENKFFEEIELSNPILEFGEQWIIPVSDVIIKKLTNCTSQELEVYADKWSKTEEWQLDEATTEDIVQLLQKISDLAKSAKSSDKIFIFMSV